MATKTNKIIIKSIGFLLIAFFVASCVNGVRYETFEKVDVSGWHYKNEKHFTIPIEEIENLNMSIAIRNTSDYEKANLWLFLTTKSPSGIVLKDTIDCTLADDYGYWLGSGFFGLYLTKHSLESGKYCNEKGDWEVTLTHGMRQDTIKGIQEIGIVVEAIE